LCLCRVIYEACGAAGTAHSQLDSLKEMAKQLKIKKHADRKIYVEAKIYSEQKHFQSLCHVQLSGPLKTVPYHDPASKTIRALPNPLTPLPQISVAKHHASESGTPA